MKNFKLLLVSFLLSTFSFPALSNPIGKIIEIKIVKTGMGQEENCKSFSITEDEVEDFFENAVIISSRQQHDFFLTGPCYAQGILKTRYDTWQWEIRNLGTGHITATNNDSFLVGDPRQESSLGGRE